MLSSHESIGLSTNGSVNIDSKSHYTNCSDIRLGDKKATEPGIESLHNSTDFECNLIRESVYFTSTYGSWLQNW